jgi:pyruvate carboxylase
VGYLQGKLGTPPGGWDADPQLMAMRLAVLGARKLEPIATDTTAAMSMAPYDFDKAKEELQDAYGARISSDDVLSHAMYPAVFTEWQTFKEIYGSMEEMPTHAFLRPLEMGQEVEFDTEPGKKAVCEARFHQPARRRRPRYFAPRDLRSQWRALVHSCVGRRGTRRSREGWGIA